MQTKDILNNMMQFNALYNPLPSFPFSNMNYWNALMMSSLTNKKINISEEIERKVEKLFDMQNKKVKIENFQNNNQINNSTVKEIENSNDKQMDVKFDEIVQFSNRFSQEFEEQEIKMKNLNSTNKEMKEKIEEIFWDLSFIKSKINQIKNANLLIDSKALSLSKRSNYLSDCYDQNSKNENFIIQQLCHKNDFKYEIVLLSEFPKRVYRDRLFNFKVVLRDIITKETVRNKNEISLDLNIFNAEECPKLIEKNNIGQKIVACNYETFCKEGYSKIDKIKIKEVSSHFLQGWIYLCVVAKPSLNKKKENNNSDFYDSDHTIVCYEDIKPLVIQNVVVKSKKMKQWKD